MDYIKKAKELLAEADEVLNKKTSNDFLKLVAEVKKHLKNDDLDKALKAEVNVFNLSEKLQDKYNLGYSDDDAGRYLNRIDDYSFEIITRMKELKKKREKDKEEIYSWIGDLERHIKNYK